MNCLFLLYIPGICTAMVRPNSAELLNLSEQDLRNIADHTFFLLPRQGESSTQTGGLLTEAERVALKKNMPEIAAQAVTGGNAIEMILSDDAC